MYYCPFKKNKVIVVNCIMVTNKVNQQVQCRAIQVNGKIERPVIHCIDVTEKKEVADSL